MPGVSSVEEEREPSKNNCVQKVQIRTMEYERYKFVTKENKWKSSHSKGTNAKMSNRLHQSEGYQMFSVRAPVEKAQRFFLFDFVFFRLYIRHVER